MRSRLQIRALTALAALSLVVACAEIKSPEDDSADVSVADSLQSSARPDQESEHARINLYEGVRVSTAITADMIWKYSLKDSVVARGLEVDFYDSTGALSAHLVSDSGVILETRRIMIAIGGVVVVNADSTRLTTEELQWNNKTGLITSDRYVTIVENGDTLRGYGFETDRSMRRIKIRRQVEASLSED
ncbi:MAG TPA: LPS export ABC transporter periplasmic protein LptC [candidate division Zixibacteria bacterium]|nr:LPS export ABC transporter periplasmic protein LptC [candidate division Zixibacteria bacterium]